MKLWKPISLFIILWSLLTYVLFIQSFSKEVQDSTSQHTLTTIDEKSADSASPIEKFVSAILLHDNTLNYQNTLYLVRHQQGVASVQALPFKPVFFSTLYKVLPTLIVLSAVALGFALVGAFFQRIKTAPSIDAMCRKTQKMMSIYGQRSEDMTGFSSLSQLNYHLKSLLQIASSHKAKAEHNALCDRLTQLTDRHAFLEHLNRVIDRTEKDPQQSAILFIDLDGFKQVNDSFGHSFGDEILIQVAERLRSIVRSQNLSFKDSDSELEYNLARLGGDEFAIFIQFLDKSEQAVNIARHVLSELERDFVLGSKIIKISASLGIAVYPESAATPSALVQMADVAMYRAKADGRGIYRIYSPEMGSKLRRYHYLLEEMRLAITANNFSLSFQPIIHVDGSSISYFEALVRWQHPVEGNISPGEFIPIAEESNLILDLGDWILDEACRQMAAWYNAGMKKARISVNISGVQLVHRPIYEWTIAALNKMGLPPSSLMLEITESCFIDVSDEVKEQLERLRNDGVMIAIDDFGTGFSSLSLLANLPVDVLKIDRLFISEAMQNPKYNNILNSIIELAQRLDLKVVAEGIEQIEQLELLKSLGVVYIQGYLISRPQSSMHVGDKVLAKNQNHIAQTGTGIWPPEKSRMIGSF